jgi:hypothetical protein
MTSGAVRPSHAGAFDDRLLPLARRRTNMRT